MEKKIAVLSDAEGAPTTLPLAEAVTIYVREDKEWQETARFSCVPFAKDTPHDLRLLGEAIADELGDVKVLLGSEISGASYSALNRVGFLLCESQGISDEFLDQLFKELDADKDVKTVEKSKSGSELANNDPPKALTSPQLSALPGHYFISLKEVQQCNPLLSTKKILRPFLTETPFVELVMLCDHVPPWLETDLPIQGLVMTVKKSDTNSYTVRIVHAAWPSFQI